MAQVAEYNRQVQLRAQQAQRSTHQYIHSFLKHELYSAIPCSFVCCTVWPRECRGSVEPADSDLPDGGPEDDHVLTQAGMENLDHDALACPCIWMDSVVGGGRGHAAEQHCYSRRGRGRDTAAAYQQGLQWLQQLVQQGANQYSSGSPSWSPWHPLHC